MIEDHQITASRVPLDQARALIAKHVPSVQQLSSPEHFENLVYARARAACEAYKGGFWTYFELSTGGFYCAPLLGRRKLHVIWPGNHFEAQMTPDAFGIGVTLMALSSLSFDLFGYDENDSVVEAFHALRAFASQHVEAELIFRFID